MNAFLDYAERAAPIRREQPRPPSARPKSDAAAAAERKLEENEHLMRRFKAARRAEMQGILDGPHGRDLRGLQSVLRTMTQESAPALVTLVERAAWLRSADENTRRVVLAIVRQAINKSREREGLPYGDDGVPWDDEPTLFERIRDLLRGPA